VLSEALKNFGVYGKLTTLGISLSQHHGSSGCSKSFLEKMLGSALDARLSITSIIFEVGVDPDIEHGDYFGIQRRAWIRPSLVQDGFLTEVTEIWTLMNALNTMSYPEIGRGFRFVRKGFEGTRESPSVVYNPQKHSLIGMHLKFDDWKVVLRWLPASTMLEVVTLFDCDIEFRVFTDLIVKTSLRTLSIEDVTLVRNSSMAGHWQFSRHNNYPWHFGTQAWAAVFDGLATRSLHPSSCRLGKLGYHNLTHTGATWQADSVENVTELLCGLRWGKRSRLVYKKENAPYSCELHKPRKKAPRSKKTRFTRKKSSENKN
jgi:hypothetical protein